MTSQIQILTVPPQNPRHRHLTTTCFYSIHLAELRIEPSSMQITKQSLLAGHYCRCQEDFINSRKISPKDISSVRIKPAAVDSLMCFGTSTLTMRKQKKKALHSDIDLQQRHK